MVLIGQQKQEEGSELVLLPGTPGTTLKSAATAAAHVLKANSGHHLRRDPGELRQLFVTSKTHKSLLNRFRDPHEPIGRWLKERWRRKSGLPSAAITNVSIPTGQI